MKAARLRLALTVLLFAGWLGYLAYLAATTTHPIVLSRPQFLMSTFDVVAQVDAEDHLPAPKVTIQEVSWPAGEQSKWAGKTVEVTNLHQAVGWQGPGEYILPLIPVGNAYQVAPTPPSPGYPGRQLSVYHIYPRTAETMRQLHSIRKPEN